MQLHPLPLRLKSPLQVDESLLPWCKQGAHRRPAYKLLTVFCHIFKKAVSVFMEVQGPRALRDAAVQMRAMLD